MGLLFIAGCRQQMASQPTFRPLQPSAFFADERSSRPLVAGTVPRGFLRADLLLETGRRFASPPAVEPAGLAGALAQPPAWPALTLAAAADPYADEFPFPITAQIMQRGRTHFNIFCAVCHDQVGTGRGMIVRRGFTQPPSLHIPRLRQARAGYLFQVITVGYGAMPDYASQIPVRDRWAIVAYVRALQLSQHASLKDVPDEVRGEF